MSNICLQTDQYKANSHWKMLPDFVKSVEGYYENRIGADHDSVIFHGLQGILKKDFVGKVLTRDKIEEADRVLRLSNYHPDYFNKQAWLDLLEAHGGRLPLKIKAVPEGTNLPIGNVAFKVRGTDPRFPWLSQRCESRLMHTWYPSVIATKSAIGRKTITASLAKSSDCEDPDEMARHLYVDFGYRGCSCDEQAAVGGTGHLVNSYASDTILALCEVDKYYGGLGTETGEIAYSVPATEHSISQTYGANGEDNYLMDLIHKYPVWICSCVSDTYNVENFINVVVRKRRAEIIRRWEKAEQAAIAPVNRMVFRPDSLRGPDDTCIKQILWIYETLDDIFGHTVNSKGYKVLHPSVGVLWGDGIKDEEIAVIYDGLVNAGWSTENQVIGQGGGLLVAGATRDTERVALKACRQLTDDGWVDVVKNPLDSSKKSKAGNLKLIIDHQLDGSREYKTVNQHYPLFHDHKDRLVDTLLDGELLADYPMNEIRERAK